MKRSILISQIAAVVLCAPLAGQAVPQESQAARVEQGYRRTPQFRVDPFRHMFIPHWGFVFSVGATAENNAININDLGALMFLNDRDSLLVVDIFDALGLVPVGTGLGGSGEAEGGFYLGGPIGSRLHIGISLQGRGYGGFRVDDNAVALLRDPERRAAMSERAAAWATGSLGWDHRVAPLADWCARVERDGVVPRVCAPPSEHVAHLNGGSARWLSDQAIAAGRRLVRAWRRPRLGAARPEVLT